MLDKLNTFSFILAPIFYKFVYMSTIASFIGIVILIIRKLFGKKLSPNWISRLWLLVLIPLICPIQFTSEFSVYNYIPKDTFVLLDHSIQDIPDISFREDYDLAKQQSHDLLDKSISKSDIAEIQKNENTTYIKSLSFDVILPYAWLLISSLLIVIYIITYITFSMRINKSKELYDERLQNILNRCKQILKVNKNIRLVNQSDVKTPSLFGIFNIWILVPENINELTDSEIEYIFMHELVHFKRKDNLLKLSLTIIKSIYIFNPIIYVLSKQIMKDIEIATDEMAVKRFDKKDKKEYCRTLVKLTDEYLSRNFVTQTLAISDNKSNLERRIKMIKLSDGFIKHKLLIAVISIILIIVLAFAFLTKPKNSDDITNNNSVNVLSEDEALNLGKDHFKRIKDLYWSWMTDNIEGSGPILKVKEVYAQNVKNMCTDKAFNDFIKYWGITVKSDGYYYLGEGFSANPRYISDELSIENIGENQITFTCTAKYDDEPSTVKSKFTLIKSGENWLVDEFTMPY